LARPADAALHLVEDQQQSVLVAKLAQPLERLHGEVADAAFSLQRLQKDCRGFRADRLLDGLEVVEGHLIETVDLRAEALEIFLLTAGGDRRQRAAVEGALECDDAIAFGMAADILIAARRLDGAFQGFRTGIGEEHLVGEGRLDQPLAETALSGNLV
ncbi:hypothetical protein COL154_014284, partial [Colletotrichum chrysophilum]